MNLENKKNVFNSETLQHIGLQIAALMHHLDFSVELDYIQFIFQALETNQISSIKGDLSKLNLLLRKKQRMCFNLLQALRQSKEKKKEKVDLIQIIESILELVKLQKEVFQKIKITNHYQQPYLYLEAIPSQIYFILQNIITNAIQAMLRIPEKNQHILSIQGKVENSSIIIVITDTGPGYTAGLEKKPLFETEISGRQGFGYRYISKIMKNYGRISINSTQNGCTVTITFKTE